MSVHPPCVFPRAASRAGTSRGELDGLSLGDEHWIPKMKGLKEVTEHHLEEEESTIFELARKAVNEQQAQDIGQAVGKTIQ